MPLEDPFFVVRDEVNATMSQVQQLYQRWSGLLEDGSVVSIQEYNSITTELHNQLKSVEWDLEDLSQTIGVVESNPGKFHLTMSDIDSRKEFVHKTRREVKEVTEQMNSTPVKGMLEQQTRKTLLGSQHDKKHKFARLDREVESDNQLFLEDQQQQQQVIVQMQDEQLQLVGQSVNVLREMGEEIGNELSTQNQMLEQFTDEIDHSQSKLDYTLLRLEKALRLADDKRQTVVIGVLVIAMVIIVLLYAFTL